MNFARKSVIYLMRAENNFQLFQEAVSQLESSRQRQELSYSLLSKPPYRPGPAEKHRSQSFVILPERKGGKASKGGSVRWQVTGKAVE